MGRKISCSSNLNRERESGSSTLVSSTNSLRLATARRVLLAARGATTASAGGSGTGGTRAACSSVGLMGWRFAAGLVAVAAGGGATDALTDVLARASAETMAPIRVGNWGSGIKYLLLSVLE